MRLNKQGSCICSSSLSDSSTVRAISHQLCVAVEHRPGGIGQLGERRWLNVLLFPGSVLCSQRPAVCTCSCQSVLQRDMTAHRGVWGTSSPTRHPLGWGRCSRMLRRARGTSPVGDGKNDVPPVPGTPCTIRFPAALRLRCGVSSPPLGRACRLDACAPPAYLPQPYAGLVDAL